MMHAPQPAGKGRAARVCDLSSFAQGWHHLGNVTWPALQSVIVLAAAPALVAWLTAQLALARFRSEKLWEKQLEMYRDIVDALHDAREFSSWHLDQIIFHQIPSDEDKEEIRRLAGDAHIKIKKVSEIGMLLISRRATSRLQRYISDREVAGSQADWHEYLEEQFVVTNETLKDFIKIARMDLRLW